MTPRPSETSRDRGRETYWCHRCRCLSPVMSVFFGGEGVVRCSRVRNTTLLLDCCFERGEGAPRWSLPCRPSLAQTKYPHAVALACSSSCGRLPSWCDISKLRRRLLLSLLLLVVLLLLPLASTLLEGQPPLSSLLYLTLGAGLYRRVVHSSCLQPSSTPPQQRRLRTPLAQGMFKRSRSETEDDGVAGGFV